MKPHLVLSVSLALFLSPAAYSDSTLNGAKNGRSPSTAGSPEPDMHARRKQLGPGDLPPRVLYVYAPDVIVNRVADALSSALQLGDIDTDERVAGIS